MESYFRAAFNVVAFTLVSTLLVHPTTTLQWIGSASAWAGGTLLAGLFAQQEGLR